MKPFQFPSSVISRIASARLSAYAIIALMTVICCGMSAGLLAADEAEASSDEPKAGADEPISPD